MGNTNGLADCLDDAENATCTLADNVKTGNSTAVAKITKDMVLDLNGYTLTIENTYGAASGPAIDIQDDASLTITNGIVINEAGAKGNINVGKNASLTIDANVKTGVSATEANSVVLGAGRVLEGGLDVTGPEGDADFGTGTTTVEINGQLKGAYTQKNNVNATINGSVSVAGNAVKAEGGNLVLNGAKINATEGGSAIVLAGEDGNVTIKCSEVTAENNAALFINGGANVASLTINSSLLKSTNNNTIKGEGKIETVTINGSRFEAKSGLKVKDGTTNFVHATYDGTALGATENVLAAADTAYGTRAACDTTAADDDEDDNKDDGAENPNTADTIATYLTIATVALLGLGATAFVAKKSNR